MRRFRQIIAAAGVLVLSVAVPLSVVRGTEYVWSGTAMLLWLLAFTCGVLWVATSEPVTRRVPYTIVRNTQYHARSGLDDERARELRQAVQSVLTEVAHIRSRAREVLDEGEQWDYAFRMPSAEWARYRGVLARDLDETRLELVFEVYRVADRVNRTTVSDELFEAVEEAADRAEHALREALPHQI